MSTETPMIYGSKVLDFVSFYSPSLVRQAAKISQETSLPGLSLLSSAQLARYMAGFLAGEYNDRYESSLDQGFQGLVDWYVWGVSKLPFLPINLPSSIAQIDAD